MGNYSIFCCVFGGVDLKKRLANLLTGFRILGSILLLFFPVFTSEFYVTYLLCGFSDMIDGTIARKTNSDSEFGARLDTVADLTFLAVSLIRLLPQIHLSLGYWIWVGAIAVIKVGTIVWGFVLEKHLLSPHTIMNKIAGLLLFLLPLSVSFVELKYSLLVVCSVATIAAILDVRYVQTKRERT